MLTTTIWDADNPAHQASDMIFDRDSLRHELEKGEVGVDAGPFFCETAEVRFWVAQSHTTTQQVFICR